MALALSGDILFSGLVSGYGLRLHLVGYLKHLHLVISISITKTGGGYQGHQWWKVWFEPEVSHPLRPKPRGKNGLRVLHRYGIS